MGGLVCLVHKNAVLRFDSVPTSPSEEMVFDKQMRELMMSESVAQGLVDAGLAQTVCAILAKQHWTHEDRQTLFDAVEHTYEDP